MGLVDSRKVSILVGRLHLRSSRLSDVIVKWFLHQLLRERLHTPPTVRRQRTHPVGETLLYPLLGVYHQVQRYQDIDDMYG